MLLDELKGKKNAKLKKKYSALPPQEKLFLEELKETGSMKKAAKESNLTLQKAEIIKIVNADILQSALLQEGITPTYMASMLKEAIEARTVRYSAKGDRYEVVDYASRIRSLEMAHRMLGTDTPNDKPNTGIIFEDIPEDELEDE